jgi:alpha-mannosidase
VREGLTGSCVDLEDLIAKGEGALRPIGQVAKRYTLLCIGHAHIDMNWMWSWPETVAVTNDTFRTMLNLMDEFPGFIFSQSQASTYHLVEKYNPPMFETIRQRVREGRWEVTASQWVEGDKNMASGESISRHLLYAREYFQERFGLSPEDVQVDFEPDTFGHPATLPTILARGGVRYYYHCRGSHGPHVYWWLGPDGSRILALNDVPWYMCTVEPAIADPLVGFSLATGIKFMPVLYGVGDHGGGPTRRDLRRLVEMKTWPVFPNVEFSTLHRFFRLAEERAQDVPEIAGERNFVFTGCYTSQARQKWANRHGENLLFTAEVAAALGDLLAGVEYPQKNLDEAWKHLLFDQFHDILPGSGVRETRHYALGRAQESQAAAGMARTNALRALSRRVDTGSLRRSFREDPDLMEARAYKDDGAAELPFIREGESALASGAGVGYGTGTGGESACLVQPGPVQASDRAFLVFNPLPHPRTEVVEVKLWNTELDEEHLVVTGDGGTSPLLAGGTEGGRGEPCRVQVLDKGRYWGHEYLTVAFPVEVPALGYRAVCVSDRLAELGLRPASSGEAYDPWAGEVMGAWRRTPPTVHRLENEFLRVELDPASGGILSLWDKRSKREWIPQGRPAGVFQYCIEAPPQAAMTAWVIGQFLKREDLLDGGTLRKIHDGPYVHTFRWTRMINDTRLELNVTVRQSVPRVDFRLCVDWREIGRPGRSVPHLKVRFPLAVHDPRARYEVPFGSVRRDLFDGEEVPALRWVDLSEADGQGVTLVNSSKYGFSLEDDTLNMTLLRSSTDPDPLPDLGRHVIEYALVPHGEGWAVGDCVRAGEDQNVPLVVTGCGFHPGDLPPAISFLAIEDRNVRLAAMRKSQDGKALILRLVEVEGKETQARLSLAPGLLPREVGERVSAVEVDTLERPLEGRNVRLEGGTLLVRVPAFGISTVCIRSG